VGNKKAINMKKEIQASYLIRMEVIQEHLSGDAQYAGQALGS